ncbi:hypothetical protein HZA96_02315 [Candidatus Woesearchaeota archaeon]|nr:hypothetical protein [Candidatus Woesearchaeota archaeon]
MSSNGNGFSYTKQEAPAEAIGLHYGIISVQSVLPEHVFQAAKSRIR